MAEFFAYVLVVIAFVMMIGKVSACGASFVLAANRDNMPEELGKITSKSDVMHGISDAAEASFFLALIVFILSKVTMMYGNYKMVYSVSTYLLGVAFFLDFIFIWAYKIRQKIADIREKWRKQKRFTAEHDNEVNYCHAMENVVEDLGLCVLMGLVTTAFTMFA